MAAITLGEWLSERPAALSRTLDERLADLLSPHHSEPLATAAESCIGIAAALLAPLALEGHPGRSSASAARRTALDLLAADALITIACELAASDCESVALQTSAWSSRIAALISGMHDTRAASAR